MNTICWRCGNHGVIERNRWARIYFCHCACGIERERAEPDYVTKANKSRLLFAPKIVSIERARVWFATKGPDRKVRKA
jgi:hypothetical protein